MKKSQNFEEIAIYQAKNGAIEFKFDGKSETILANMGQISELFGVGKAAISKHLGNIFRDGELEENSVVSILETAASDGKNYQVNHYNLDAILAVGYRVNSKQATNFRIWATKILRNYLISGFVVDKAKISKNYDEFNKILQDLKDVIPQGRIESGKLLDLVNNYAKTWLSLDAYDKNSLPSKGLSKQQIELDCQDLEKAIAKFKQELIAKKQATTLFAQEKNRGSVQGIFGNIFQSFGGDDLYPTLEEKAAHLLYFIIKNHPFNDGNKRSAAFSFVWFLTKVKLLKSSLNAESLTLLTIVIAESDPKDKKKIISLILNIIN